MTQPVEKARLLGHIYRDGEQWRCTSHGGALSQAIVGQGPLIASCCGREVEP